MSTDRSADEMLGSLNGFDELAIAKQFKTPIQGLIPDPEKGREGPSPWVYLRALAFIDMKRDGKSDREAYDEAMSLTTTDAQEYFADPPAEIDPEEPDSELGKDSSPSE